MASIERICIQWPRFGPYHLARLEAAHRAFRLEGIEVIGLETAGQDATYAWDAASGPETFRRVQVFPDAVFETLQPSALHAGMTAVLDRLRPDAVAINSYSMPDARACLAWCRRHRRVAILMTDSKADDAPRAAWRERVKAVLVGQFDAALLAGTPHRDYIAGLGLPETVIFLGYDVIDNAFFERRADDARRCPDAHRHLPGLDRPAPFFLASGRFVPRKNLDGLLRAYAAYRTGTDTPWRLVLLGDGPERPHLEALIAEEGIDGVTLAGFRQIEDLPTYYGLASAFVHPATTDQWGLVVNEAMAAGLPVLVSEGAGCARDLVAEGDNGYRFAPDDIAGLATLMGRVAAPQTDRDALGERSRARIAAWSPERFADSLLRAVRAGLERGERPLAVLPRLVLRVLRLASRDVRSFHAIRD